MTFRLGAKDGLPIALGYFAVAISFGVASVGYGFPIWSPIVVSLTNFTGSGQALGIQLLSVASTTLFELVVAMLVINLRYALMSVTISQRLDKRVTIGQRLLMAFGMTDENFAAALMRNREITFGYMMGLELTSFCGWVGGTVVGTAVGDFLPPVIMTAFKIALPAMFIAIVIPPCRKSRANTVVVVLAVALSCLFFYVPGLNALSKGWVYVVCGLAAAVIGALIFPVPDEPDELVQNGNVRSVVSEKEAVENGGTGESDAPNPDNDTVRVQNFPDGERTGGGGLNADPPEDTLSNRDDENGDLEKTVTARVKKPRKSGAVKKKNRSGGEENR